MVVILPYCIKAKRCEHNALGYWSGLALCLTKVRSSRARCPATALINYRGPAGFLLAVGEWTTASLNPCFTTEVFVTLRPK